MLLDQEVGILQQHNKNSRGRQSALDMERKLEMKVEGSDLGLGTLISGKPFYNSDPLLGLFNSRNPDPAQRFGFARGSLESGYSS